jgi:hypothetical protein
MGSFREAKGLEKDSSLAGDFGGAPTLLCPSSGFWSLLFKVTVDKEVGRKGRSKVNKIPKATKI